MDIHTYIFAFIRIPFIDPPPYMIHVTYYIISIYTNLTRTFNQIERVDTHTDADMEIHTRKDSHMHIHTHIFTFTRYTYMIHVEM